MASAAPAAAAVRNVVILGSGPAGLTAALYTARASLAPLVLHGDQPGGQLTTTTEIENFPGFVQGVDGNELVETMQKQAERFGTEMKFGEVTRIEPSAGAGAPLQVHVTGGDVVAARAVIVATGAHPRKLGIPSEEKYWTHGVTACATCDGFFFKGMDVCIIGGGDSACEEALYLTRMCTKVFMIHRRDELRASKIMRQRILAHPKVEMVWNAVVDEILGDGEKVTGVRVASTTTGGEKRDIPLRGVFLAIGHVPNTGFLKGTVDLDPAGYVVTPHMRSTATSVPGIFAAGDCADHIYRQAVTAAGTGCMAAIEVERHLESLSG